MRKRKTSYNEFHISPNDESKAFTSLIEIATCLEELLEKEKGIRRDIDIDEIPEVLNSLQQYIDDLNHQIENKDEEIEYLRGFDYQRRYDDFLFSAQRRMRMQNDILYESNKKLSIMIDDMEKKFRVLTGISKDQLDTVCDKLDSLMMIYDMSDTDRASHIGKKLPKQQYDALRHACQTIVNARYSIIRATDIINISMRRYERIATNIYFMTDRYKEFFKSYSELKKLEKELVDIDMESTLSDIRGVSDISDTFDDEFIDPSQYDDGEDFS